MAFLLILLKKYDIISYKMKNERGKKIVASVFEMQIMYSLMRLMNQQHIII